jgi:tRNA(Ile)-lysidine synthase
MTKTSAILNLARHLFSAGDRICCAVSGGADSVALLLALHEANGAKESLGIVLSAIHVNHGLRGDEANADEAFVGSLCNHLGLPLLIERVDTRGRQGTEREGVEEAARELRYETFRNLLAAGRVDAVATGHTLDDQAETVILKLLRGAWTEGLGGISPEILPGISPEILPRNFEPVTRQGPKSAGRIIRPMLSVRREEVEAFLRERRQDWREDSTNRDLSLTRNRVRHELMPALRGFNPAIDAALARLAEIARDEEAFWQAEVARLLPGLVLPGKPVRGGGRAVSTSVGEVGASLELTRLGSLAPALRRRVVRAAARGLGVRLSGEETAKLLALAGFGQHPTTRARIGSRLELGGGLRAERSARELRLLRSSQAAPSRPSAELPGLPVQKS